MDFPPGAASEAEPAEAASPAPGAHLHVPVQADGREEQALHTLKRDGPLLLVVDKKGQSFSI